MTRDQQRYVWSLWNQGMNTAQIGKRLVIPEQEVDSFKSRMMDEAYIQFKRDLQEIFRC